MVVRQKAHHVARQDSDDVDDPDVRKDTGAGPLVDSRGADSEDLRDLADRQELLDRR
jgi:hypothetical protein